MLSMDTASFIRHYTQATRRLLLLDYDGVLAPIVSQPEQAAPTDELRRLLRQLSDDVRNTIVIISGRPHETLDEWLGDLKLQFAAEHGLWRRTETLQWQIASDVDLAWMSEVEAIMIRSIQHTTGGMIEQKHGAVALHYRNIPAADFNAAAVVAQLKPIVTTRSLGLLDGKKVIEVVAEGVDKGAAAQFWLQLADWDFICGFGDDVTDEALFEAVPDQAFSIKVGPGETAASSRLEAQPEAIELLKLMAKS